MHVLLFLKLKINRDVIFLAPKNHVEHVRLNIKVSKVFLGAMAIDIQPIIKSSHDSLTKPLFNLFFYLNDSILVI